MSRRYAESQINREGRIRCFGGKVLGSRYSQALPEIWRAEIREEGNKDEIGRSNQTILSTVACYFIKKVEFV